jgi:DHA1 family purine ribonucleoside efflux pump-like MFS transporter
MSSSAAAAEPIDLQPAGQRPAWAAVWALGLTVATLNASEMLPASLLTPMAAGLDASEGLIGQSVSATAVMAIATSLVVSPLTRRVYRRRRLLGVAAAQVLSNLIVALAPTAGIRLAGRVLL